MTAGKAEGELVAITRNNIASSVHVGSASQVE
jgi:hypothetical protein